MAEKSENRETEAGRRKRLSRRRFLKTAAAGAAAAGFATAAPRILAGEVPLSTIFGGAPEDVGGEPIVAYVGDARTGEIVLMAGDRKVRIRDLGMVSSFLRAFSGL